LRVNESFAGDKLGILTSLGQMVKGGSRAFKATQALGAGAGAGAGAGIYGRGLGHSSDSDGSISTDGSATLGDVPPVNSSYIRATPASVTAAAPAPAPAPATAPAPAPTPAPAAPPRTNTDIHCPHNSGLVVDLALPVTKQVTALVRRSLVHARNPLFNPFFALLQSPPKPPPPR
jgi:hypothetical protein